MGRYDNLVEQIRTINTEEIKDWYSNMSNDMKVIEAELLLITAIRLLPFPESQLYDRQYLLQ